MKIQNIDPMKLMQMLSSVSLIKIMDSNNKQMPDLQKKWRPNYIKLLFSKVSAIATQIQSNGKIVTGF